MFSLHENYLALASPKEKLLPLVGNFMEKDKEHRNKGGRPRKSDARRKSRTVGVCFSEPEYYAVKHRADKAGLPVSIYCHDAILLGTVAETIKKEDLELLKQLSAMGNNLNQLTRLAHIHGVKIIENNAVIILKNLIEIINKLSDDWKNHKRKKL